MFPEGLVEEKSYYEFRGGWMLSSDHMIPHSEIETNRRSPARLLTGAYTTKVALAGIRREIGLTPSAEIVSRILWLEADHLTGVFNIAVSPPIARSGMEDVKLHIAGGLNATTHHLRDVAVAAPDGVMT